MSLIDVRNLSFYYEGSYDYIFENVNLRIDTCWRLGLVGRNGRGKTTFLNLLRGKMKYQGEIITDTVFDYFPFEVPWPEKSVMDVISDVDADGEFWKVCREDVYKRQGHGTLCLIGDYDPQGKGFVRKQVQAIDYGLDFYAPQTLLAPEDVYKRQGRLLCRA